MGPRHGWPDAEGLTRKAATIPDGFTRARGRRSASLAAAQMVGPDGKPVPRRTIAEHKLFAAEHFATEDGVAKALEPVLKAIERLTDRLDRFLTDGGSTTRPPNPRAR